MYDAVERSASWTGGV